MSDRGPVAVLLEKLDRPVAPRPEFADALRARLLAELAEQNGRRPRRWISLARPSLARRRRRRLVAGAVALAVLAAGVTAVTLSRPSRASALDVIRKARRAFAETPPFQATVRVDLNPDGANRDRLVPKGATATVVVSYGGSKGFRTEVVSVRPPVPDASRPGSYQVYDGRASGTFDPQRNVFFSAGQSAGFGPLDFLSWHGGYPDWDRVCRGPASTVLPDGRIARRDVRHVRCGDYRGDIWELWIDRETGLLLKVVGEVGGGDFGLLPGPATSAKGGFEVEQLRYNPAFPDGTFSVVAPPGSIDYQRRLQAARSRAPSFRAVVDWGTGKQTYQEKVAWLSDRRWRRDVLSAERGDPALPGGAGSFAVWADGRLQRYNARDNTYSRVSSPGSDPRDALLPEADFGYSTAACRVVGRERVAGRRAVHRRCKAEDFWIDSSTGLTLRKRAPEGELRVRSIEFRPTFPPSTFRFSSPTGSRSAQEVQRERDRTKTRLTPGKLAPAWQAPKLGGGAFRVADLRGKPAFLLFLADWCPGTDPACDVLGPFKAAYERFKDEVAFVWVDPQGRTVEARKIARHNGLTLPVVVDSKGASIKAWNIEGVPYWVLLDADGRVIEARYKPQTTAKLDELLTKETGRP